MTITPGSIRVVPLEAARFEEAWQLRLRALREHPEAFGQPYEDAARLSPEEARASFDTFWTYRDNRVFVAIDPDNRLVGMIGVAREDREKRRHRGKIWGVYVAPEARGKGVGAGLLDAAIAHCRNEAGLLQIHLQVISSNLAAVRSYERAGFVRYGRLPRADILDGQAIDNDLMVLMLDGYPAP